jgi:hypothetical protein
MLRFHNIQGFIAWKGGLKIIANISLIPFNQPKSEHPYLKQGEKL